MTGPKTTEISKSSLEASGRAYEKLPLPQQGGAVSGGLAALFHTPVLNSLQSAAAEVELEAQHSSNVGATVELDAAELEATRTTINLVNMLNEGASLNMSEVVAAVEAIADNADNAGVESSVAVEAFVETEATIDLENKDPEFTSAAAELATERQEEQTEEPIFTTRPEQAMITTIASEPVRRGQEQGRVLANGRRPLSHDSGERANHVRRYDRA